MDGQEGNLQVKSWREVKGLGDLKGICMSRFGDGVEAQGNSKGICMSRLGDGVRD